MSDLRRVIVAASLLALAPNFAPKFANAQQSKAAPFKAPDKNMILTRELHRPLADGKAVVTRRSYAVQFIPVGSGYRVEGQLIRVEVDAPPALAALAELERNRRDTGPFPLRVDRNGMIFSAATPIDQQSLRNAGAHTGQAIRKSRLPSAEKKIGEAFVQQITTNELGATTAWPSDLFNPAAPHRSETRDLVTDGGATGQVTLEHEATTKGGLLLNYERRVTTDTGGSKKTTRERWILTDG